jgi:hypothetical protein
MEVEQADHRMRAYAALEALRTTLVSLDRGGPLRNFIDPLYVGQFDTALEHLAATGENIDEYRIPDAAIKDLAGGRFVDADYLLARVNAILGYFTLRDAVQAQAHETNESLRRLIGFETPRN